VQIVQNSPALQELVQHSQQLKYIAQNSTSLQELPQIKQKLDENSQIVENAVRTSDEAANVANSNTGSIAKLYSTLTALKGDTKLISEYRAQQTKLSNDINQQRESIYALDAKIDSARKEWTEPINKLTADIKTADSSLFVQGKRIDSLGQQLDDVKGSVSSFEKALDVDQILEFCAVIPQFILAISQFQQALEDINTNLPGGGLAFKFSLDLNELHERFIKKAPISEGRTRV
jgi:chromosome segregation ATPase